MMANAFLHLLWTVKRGDRIAQLIIEVIAHPDVEEVSDLDSVRSLASLSLHFVFTEP
jgi:dUTPase